MVRFIRTGRCVIVRHQYCALCVSAPARLRASEHRHDDVEAPQRLAAILVADIASYTSLMELDEIGVVEAWRRARTEVIDPTVARHHGRIVKLTGDGFLAEFPTVESAVKAATLPVLMVNGRYDYPFTVDVSQRPLFEMLSTPNADKKHVILESGHGSLPRSQTVREVLAWLDQYVGPVAR